MQKRKMKATRHILTILAMAVMACSCFCSSSRPKDGIAGYSIVYPAGVEDEEGLSVAIKLQELLLESYGKTLEIKTSSSGKAAYEILVGRCSNKASEAFYSGGYDTFDYIVRSDGRKIVLAGGGSWALNRGAEVLSKAAGKGLPIFESGNVYGEYLFSRQEGSNLRIMDCNIWDYTGTGVPDAWKVLGEDPSDEVRCRGFAAITKAFLPDVFSFQEYSMRMNGLLMPLISEDGYRMAYECSGNEWNFTPVMYNANNVELLESSYCLHGPAGYNNAGTKSYTAAVFRHKATSKLFIVVNTHLWWKDESAKPGSDAARSSQIRDIMKAISLLINKYDCPAFLMGDMNCNLRSEALKQLTDAGYQPVWDIATVYGDKSHGHHECYATGFSRDEGAAARSDGTSSIDHFMLYNGQRTVVKTFRRVTDYFTVPITDHYPNYADIVLQ